jgi:RimJ/RimL family protein N-acetyltransferase
MRLVKIFNCGKVINENLYLRLKILDARVFFGCNNEFKKNRDWWVIVDDNNIIAYCGCLYSQKICIFVRAWVYKEYRGLGIQKRMIKARIKYAKKICTTVITYTSTNNIISANNLLKNGFLLYNPMYKYSGSDVLYFKKDL